MHRSLVVMLCLSLALAGCKAKELADKDAISKDLKERGTTDLMKEIAEDQYTAPEDGRLTDAQIQMYLKVREHEKKIAEVAKAELKKHAAEAEKKEKSIAGMMDSFKALGSAADFMTADIRAAKDLDFNTQEYLWVKQQVLEASTSQMAEQFSTAMATNFDKAYAEAKKAHDEASDEQTKKLYADVLAGYDKSKQEMTAQENTEDPAVAHNKKLLAKYENVLNAYAQEMAKYSDKPEEAQKAVEQMTQQAAGQK
jgi:hypothetical protein